MPYKTFILLILTFSITVVTAQQTDTLKTKKAKPEVEIAQTALYNEIVQADSTLFHAFNMCDSLTYKKYFTDDLEFYHDIGGLSVGLAIEIEEFRQMCTRGNHIRRELVKSSLEVYPIKNYGAVEIGIHRFFHTNKGESEKPSGTYKFIQVWQKKDSQWKISRVISYGHDNMKSD